MHPHRWGTVVCAAALVAAVTQLPAAQAPDNTPAQGSPAPGRAGMQGTPAQDTVKGAALLAEARKALGVADAVHPSIVPGKPLIALNGPARSYEDELDVLQDDDHGAHYVDCFGEEQDEEPEPVRIRVGFASRPRRH